MACHEFMVGGLLVHCPDWLPKTGWSIHSKGYVIYTSRRVQDLIKRGEYMHRVVMRVLGGGELSSDDHVHHISFSKAMNCPMSLVKVPASMNPANALRCPFTGQYLTKDEYRARGLGA